RTVRIDLRRALLWRLRHYGQGTQQKSEKDLCVFHGRKVYAGATRRESRRLTTARLQFDTIGSALWGASCPQQGRISHPTTKGKFVDLHSGLHSADFRRIRKEGFA